MKDLIRMAYKEAMKEYLKSCSVQERDEVKMKSNLVFEDSHSSVWRK